MNERMNMNDSVREEIEFDDIINRQRRSKQNIRVQEERRELELCLRRHLF